MALLEVAAFATLSFPVGVVDGRGGRHGCGRVVHGARDRARECIGMVVIGRVSLLVDASLVLDRGNIYRLAADWRLICIKMVVGR